MISTPEDFVWTVYTSVTAFKQSITGINEKAEELHNAIGNFSENTEFFGYNWVKVTEVGKYVGIKHHETLNKYIQMLENGGWIETYQKTKTSTKFVRNTDIIAPSSIFYYENELRHFLCQLYVTYVIFSIYYARWTDETLTKGVQKEVTIYDERNDKTKLPYLLLEDYNNNNSYVTILEKIQPKHKNKDLKCLFACLLEKMTELTKNKDFINFEV